MAPVTIITRRLGGAQALACAALACAALPALAAPENTFRPWLDSWQAAVARADSQAVAALVKTPFLFEGAALDRAAFVQKAWPALFSSKLRACWARAKPVAEGGDITLTCAPYTLYFEPAAGAAGRGAWLLREFNADGEP